MPGSMPPRSDSGNRFRTLFAAAVVAVGVGVVLWAWPDRTPVRELVRQGRLALESDQLELAAELADRAVARDPGSNAVRLLAGETSFAVGEFDAALGHYAEIPDDGSLEAVTARRLAGDVYLFQLHRMSLAEAMFQRAISQDPDNLLANERLAYLFGQAARSWEATGFELARIRLRIARPEHLAHLCLGNYSLDTPETFRKYQRADPADPAPAIALAQIALLEQRYDRARGLLEDVVAHHPGQVEAQVKLGRVLLESSSGATFREWHDRLPADADRHPGTWLIRGFWCRRHELPRQAARCFWESLRRDPNNPAANYQLGRLLAALDRPDDADVFLERSRLLNSYVNAVKVAGTAAEIVLVIEVAGRLGLAWEAWGWSQVIGQPAPQPERTLVTRTAEADNPAFAIDLAGFPLPERLSTTRDDPHPAAVDHDMIAIRFEDTASSAGIDFRYVNGGRPVEDGIRFLQESTGGGVAVLDYDADGWPDLYLAQGSRWPPDESQREHLDRLFRNLGDGRFADVTVEAGLAENRFSQGVAVGDVNNDGFPDLFVGNIGANRLYINNTDGTFRDATDAAGVGDERWTTSCLIADVNGDGWPDIYSVNYLAGSDVFTRVCRVDGQDRLCPPQAFPTAGDRLYQGDGAGGFGEVTTEAGIVAADGAGLGIVAALNRLGQVEACMGIAAGDSDGDGQIDLFVTNFEYESNTLYRQVAGTNFVDATQAAGLHVNGLPLMGFGTQFLDADLDGRLDLFVANGHIERDPRPGAVYQMPPQFFRNAVSWAAISSNSTWDAASPDSTSIATADPISWSHTSTPPWRCW